MLTIYKSSAGSGKTYTLVREYLRIALQHHLKYRSILAITFTNKAAAEMKTRIVETLKGIATGAESTADMARELSDLSGKTETQLREDARIILRHMLHNYADISVSTIDSFVHRIVRAFAHDLHLPMNFEIEMDSNKLLSQAVSLLLDRLNETDPQLTQAVLDFAESKVEEGQSWNLETDLVKLGRELFRDEAQPYLQRLTVVDIHALRDTKRALIGQMKRFEQRAADIAGHVFHHLVAQGYEAADFHYTSKGIFGYFKSFAEGKIPAEAVGNKYVQATIFEDNWGKKSRVSEDVKDLIRKGYHHLNDHYTNAGPDYFLCEQLLRNFHAFVLLADLQQLMAEIKKTDNVLHISDFQHKVYELVKEQIAPVIYERIGEKYDSILIDEFQDTSVMQWRNLLPLIENAQLKNEDSLIVGDSKQAIYRFRGGEAAQFTVLPAVLGSDEDPLLKERETAIRNYGVDLRNLAFNYRSAAEIVAFNNDLYETLAELPELYDRAAYDGLRQQPGKNKTGGFVRIEFLGEGDTSAAELAELRNVRVMEIIGDVTSRGYAWKDIAVLARSNKNASEVASFLVQQGIRVVSPESLLIDQSPSVQLVLATLQYLLKSDNIIHRAGLLHFACMLGGKNPSYEQFDFHMDPEMFERAVSAASGFDFRSDCFTSGRLGDLVRQIMAVFKLSDHDPFLQFFADEVLYYASRYGNAPEDFLGWWETVKEKKSIIYPDSMDAVRIMTIHKSKGLQFPVVILADANGTVKHNKDFFWVELSKSYLPGVDTGILAVNDGLQKTEFRNLYDREEGQSFMDMLNVLYVGTTRPEDALFILSEKGKERSEKPGSKEPKIDAVMPLLRYYLERKELWKGFETYTFGNENFKKSGKAKKETGPELYQTLKQQPGKRLLSGMQIKVRAEVFWSDETNGKIDAGNLLHEALRQVRYAGDEELVVRKMCTTGLIGTAEADSLLEKLRNVVRHEQVSAFFRKELTVLNERPLWKPEEAVRIPDRVVLNGKTAVVIDYKTGAEKPEHKQQVQEYAQLLRACGWEVVRGILFYTATMKTEDVI